MASRAANVYRRAEISKRRRAAVEILQAAFPEVEYPESFPFVRDAEYAANDRDEEITIFLERLAAHVTEKNHGRREANQHQASAA